MLDLDCKGFVIFAKIFFGLTVWQSSKIHILLEYYYFLRMQVRIKTVHSLPPEYKTAGACAFDFQASEEVIFAP